MKFNLHIKHVLPENEKPERNESGPRWPQTPYSPASTSLWRLQALSSNLYLNTNNVIVHLFCDQSQSLGDKLVLNEKVFFH